MLKNYPVNLTLCYTISCNDAKRLLSLTFQTDKDGNKLRKIQEVGTIRVDRSFGKGTAAANFCERMCKIGLMNTTVASWGYEETDFCITALGQKAINAIKKNVNL